MKFETKLAELGTSPEKHEGAVNTPVYRASTILFESLADFELSEKGQYTKGFTYGRYGTPTVRALEQAIASIEGAQRAVITPSGLSAIVATLMAFLKAGDHLLMVDTVYGPTRRTCEYELKRFGVEVTYYDPTIGAGIEALIQPNTKMVYLESPGSLTFEVQDVPAIVKAAHAKGVLVAGDNTWGTPYYYKALELGMDISIHSATKYISGHSDFVMGTIACNEELYNTLIKTVRNLGMSVSSDNCYLALRGLRTLAVRMPRHFESALKVAKWLEGRPEVEKVLHPALPGAPGHELWKRDYTGACGLFAFQIGKRSRDALAAMLEGMEHFGMGYSWGGFESLLIPVSPEKIRTAKAWDYDGVTLRIHVGLEEADDLIADLDAGFARLAKHA